MASSCAASAGLLAIERRKFPLRAQTALFPREAVDAAEAMPSRNPSNRSA
jgi:hypothetical protein